MSVPEDYPAAGAVGTTSLAPIRLTLRIETMNCAYCDRIASAAPGYAVREADFDLGSEMPRCRWHWRLRCDHCGMDDHFMSRFFCERSQRLLCRESGQVREVVGPFWGWAYWWVLSCACGAEHPSLDRSEFLGVHPWQLDASWQAAARWMSDEQYLARYPRPQPTVVPEATVTDQTSRDSWNAFAETWRKSYGERGDMVRRYVSDPALFAFLGELAGRRILDAGCGMGYLSRLLSGQGARVVGVENAERLLEIAREHERTEYLGIEYHHASLSAMPFLADASFDAAVANFVIQDVRDYATAITEIGRVLKHGAPFIVVMPQGTPIRRWYRSAPDDPRKEHRPYYTDDGYFVRSGVYYDWSGHKVLTFRRPIRDYVAACRKGGFTLTDLEEPEVSVEGRRTLPSYEVDDLQRQSLALVLKFERG